MIRPVSVVTLCLLLGACASARAPRVALPQAPPPGEPAGLVGLDAVQLRAAFGAPAFVRKDGGIEMWRYDSAACRAFFFLYPQGNGVSVRHVETLPRGTTIAADASCLAALQTRPSPVS